MKTIGRFEYTGKVEGDARYLRFDFGLVDEKCRSVGAIAYIKNIAEPGGRTEFKIWTSPARNGDSFGRAKTLEFCTSMREAEKEVAESLEELFERAKLKYGSQ
jgi:hypothetical protein